MDRLILVLYLDIREVDVLHVKKYVEEVSKSFNSQFNDSNIIFIIIPIKNETRIECVSPKFITNQEIIDRNNKNFEELNEKLTKYLNQIINEQ
jgi:hypothetical protein